MFEPVVRLRRGRGDCPQHWRVDGVCPDFDISTLGASFLLVDCYPLCEEVSLAFYG